MYFVDSMSKHVYSYDYDDDSGTISNRTVFVDYAKDNELGVLHVLSECVGS